MGRLDVMGKDALNRVEEIMNSTGQERTGRECCGAGQ